MCVRARVCVRAIVCELIEGEIQLGGGDDKAVEQVSMDCIIEFIPRGE